MKYALLLLSLTLVSTAFAGDKSPINKTWRGIAVDGYDVVAYFEAKAAVEGDSNFKYEYKDATWYFSSSENLALFKKAPESYMPQYGGYCAWAVSQNSTANIDPEAWKIIDGKLYLNYNAKIQKRWEKDIPGHIEAANLYWPKVLKN